MTSAEADGTELSIVLPCHNELTLLGSTITNLVTGLEARDRTFELIVVENGSSDGTLRLARLLEAQFGEIRVIALRRGDYGAAMQTGIATAKGAIVVCFDVDYYDLGFLDQALAQIEMGADIVVASKRARGARDERPLSRRVLTAGFSLLLRHSLGLGVSDAHGMKVLRRSTTALLSHSCTMHRSMFDIELVLRAEMTGLTVREIPARVSERRSPRTSVGRRVLESFVGILELRARLWLEQRAQLRERQHDA